LKSKVSLYIISLFFLDQKVNNPSKNQKKTSLSKLAPTFNIMPSKFNFRPSSAQNPLEYNPETFSQTIGFLTSKGLSQWIPKEKLINSSNIRKI